MSALIHALFQRPDIAAKAVANLEAAGIARSDISIVEGGEGGTQEASQILSQHGMSSETAASYAHSLGQGAVFLWLRLDQGQQAQTDIAALLQRDGAMLVDTTTISDQALDDELTEIDGWDDFNVHGNEHSPDTNAESMWKDRRGRVR